MAETTAKQQVGAFQIKGLSDLSRTATRFLKQHPNRAELAVKVALETAASQFDESANIEGLPDALKPFVVARPRGNDMIGVSEAASRLNVSRTTVYDWADKGTLLAWRGTKRGLTIPAEQILGEGRVVEGVDRVVDIIGDPELAWEFLSVEGPFADPERSSDRYAERRSTSRSARFRSVLRHSHYVTKSSYPEDRVEALLTRIRLPPSYRIFSTRHAKTPLGTAPSDSRFCAATSGFTVLYAAPDFATAFIEVVVRDRFRRKKDREIALKEVTLRSSAQISSSPRSKLSILDLRKDGCTRLGAPTDAVNAKNHAAGRALGRDLYTNHNQVDGSSSPPGLPANTSMRSSIARPQA